MSGSYLGRVGGHGVEDVDQHQEQRDQERHAAGDNVRRHNKTGVRGEIHFPRVSWFASLCR